MSRPRPTAKESAERASTETVKKAFAKSGQLKYTFNMPIGDWSDDGHGKTETFVFGCNKPFNDVVDAFRKAARADQDISPTEIFHDYENHSLTEDAYFAIFDAGFDMLAGFNEAKEHVVNEISRTRHGKPSSSIHKSKRRSWLSTSFGSASKGIQI